MMNAALFFSGGASTARSIIEACNTGALRGLVKPVLGIASRPCDGIRNCLEAGMAEEDVVILQRSRFESPELHAEAILKECRARGVDFIGLYGYTTLVHPIVIDAYSQMIVNQHPGPLDPTRLYDFGGKGMSGLVVHDLVITFAKATRWQFDFTEGSAQRVTEQYDRGVVVGRTRLDLTSDDTPESVHTRLLPLEHALQIQVIRDFATDTVQERIRPEPLIPPHWVNLFVRAKEEVLARHKK